MSEDVDLETVASLLGDDVVRAILTATSQEPMSATELSDHCDRSLPTVTRRLDRLTDADLVAETTRPRADGHHDTVYAPTLSSVRVDLADGEFETAVERADGDAADRLTSMWRGL